MKNSLLILLALLCFAPSAQADNLSASQRGELNELLTRIVQREVNGATVRIERSKISKGRIWLETTVGFSYYPFREANVQAIYDSVRAVFPASYRKARVEIYTDKQEIRDLIPFAFRSPAAMKKQVRFTNSSARPLVKPLSGLSTPTKGLADRHIALWQSHGRYFDQTRNRWKWQRSCLWQTCEDLYTQSYVLPYLVPMLENAGANVLLPRERDVQKTEIIVDRDGAERGVRYAETQGRERWTDGGRGFAHTQQVYLTGENPFAAGGTRSVHTVTEGAESRAEWLADIPATDDYAVYVSYRTTSESADDAQYTVHHAGGESRFAVNQTMGGGTWIYLGTFRLDAGRDVAVVTLSNRSRQAGRTVSADAVKIGGGYGNIARTVCDSIRRRRPAKENYTTEVSGYPRFCEGARYWLQWAGFGEEVYAPKNHGDDYKEDFMSRAHWVNALAGGSEALPGEPGLHIPVDMALAFHSDAGVRDGDEVIGTLGIFCTRDDGGKFHGGASRYRSRDLTDLVMTQVVADIRRTYEPAWMRRGLWNRSYYEARVPVVPTMLLELLSHQNFADMRYGSDPRFKFLVSRAVYKGILRYLASQYNVPYVVQPLPVAQLATAFAEGGDVTLSWEPVLDSLEVTAAPTGYIVYTRKGDGGFDNGRYTDRPRFEGEQEPGVIYSYKVTAVNEGGESFPSEIVAACRVPDSRGTVLVINGFDRVSAPPSECCDTTAGFCTGADSGVPYLRDISFIGAQRVFDRTFARLENDSLALGASNRDYEMEVIAGNTFDYPYLHGRAIAAAGYSFCSASAKALERGAVRTEGYNAIDLILGKQRTTTLGRGVLGPEFRCFTPELQEALGAYLRQGGGVFVSGSYVAADLWENPEATDADREFAENVLHYTTGGSRAAERGRVWAVHSPAGFARGEFDFNQFLSGEQYAVESPDALRPAGEGAFAVLQYAENRRPAGVGYIGDYRAVTIGFPFESITSASKRERLMSNILDFITTKK